MSPDGRRSGTYMVIGQNVNGSYWNTNRLAWEEFRLWQKKLPCRTASVQFFQNHCRAGRLYHSATSQTEQTHWCIKNFSILKLFIMLLVTDLWEDEWNAPSNWLSTVKDWLLTYKELLLKLESSIEISWGREIKGPLLSRAQPEISSAKRLGRYLQGGGGSLQTVWRPRETGLHASNPQFCFCTDSSDSFTRPLCPS